MLTVLIAAANLSWPNRHPLLPIAVSSGHKDSVTCAGFSHDSTYVATGDMSGLIKVWRVDTKEEIWSFEVGDLEVRSGERELKGHGSWSLEPTRGGESSVFLFLRDHVEPQPV